MRKDEKTTQKMGALRDFRTAKRDLGNAKA